MADKGGKKKKTTNKNIETLEATRLRDNVGTKRRYNPVVVFKSEDDDDDFEQKVSNSKVSNSKGSNSKSSKPGVKKKTKFRNENEICLEYQKRCLPFYKYKKP